MSDHVTEAKRCLDAVHDWQAEGGETDETMTTVALEAQTHATLALVEQQQETNRRLEAIADEVRRNHRVVGL